MQLLTHSGIFGVMILLNAGCVLLGNVLLVVLMRTWRARVIAVFLSLMPLFIGLAGTALGFRAVQDAAAAMPPPVDPELIEAGHRAAWATTKLGLAATVLLLLITLACVALGPKRDMKQQ
jgi:hypothetical protein